MSAESLVALGLTPAAACDVVDVAAVMIAPNGIPPGFYEYAGAPAAAQPTHVLLADTWHNRFARQLWPGSRPAEVGALEALASPIQPGLATMVSQFWGHTSAGPIAWGSRGARGRNRSTLRGHAMAVAWRGAEPVAVVAPYVDCAPGRGRGDG